MFQLFGAVASFTGFMAFMYVISQTLPASLPPEFATSLVTIFKYLSVLTWIVPWTIIAAAIAFLFKVYLAFLFIWFGVMVMKRLSGQS